MVGFVMAVLFPAGRNPLTAKAWALAMRGRNAYVMMRDHHKGEEHACPNSTKYFMDLCAGADEDQLRNVMDAEGCLWSVLEHGCVGWDSAPILISANFNPAQLGGMAVGRSEDELLPIGKKTGADRSLLEDKAIVVVRKNGSVQVIKKKYLTRGALLGGSDCHFDNVCYLTPSRRVCISNNVLWIESH